MRIELGDGLHLFKREHGKSKFYWCGFHQNGKYHRKSTKTDDVELASEFSYKWLSKIKTKTKGKKKTTSSIVKSKTVYQDPHRLVVYKRRGYRNWYCRVIIDGKLFIKSTGQLIEKTATEFSKEWYSDLVDEIRNGHIYIKKGKTFEDVSNDFIVRYEKLVESKQKSREHFKNIKNIIENRLMGFYKNYPLPEIDNKSWWEFKDYISETYRKDLSPQTLHQYKNSLRLVLNEGYKQGLVETLVVFKEDTTSRQISNPRDYFSPKEYKVLINELRKNITKHKKTRWSEDSEELLDFVLMGSNSGCRVGELRNIRFCDVSIKEDKDFKDKKGNYLRYLIIENIKGKRGEGGMCKTYFGCVRSFERIIERHGLTLKNYKKSKELIFKKHHRDMFNQVLETCNLKYTNSRPRRRRDFVSLRHTYISFRLLNGVPVFEVAMNTRTSVDMIERHYNKLKPVMSKTINNTIGTIFGYEETI